MLSKNTPCLIRFRKDSIKTLSQIDAICHQQECSRSEAIRIVFDRLSQVDESELSPLYGLSERTVF